MRNKNRVGVFTPTRSVTILCLALPTINLSPAFDGFTHKALAVLRESSHGGGGSVALRIGGDDAFVSFKCGHTGIGGTGVDSDNLRPSYLLLCSVSVLWLLIPPVVGILIFLIVLLLCISRIGGLYLTVSIRITIVRFLSGISASKQG